jgi:hypothetical protein
VISKVRPSFWRAYERLSSSVKARAKLAWKIFEREPNHPSLRFKKLQARNDLWSVRINEQYRRSVCVPATRLNGFGSVHTMNSTIYFRERKFCHRQRKVSRRKAAVFAGRISGHAKTIATRCRRGRLIPAIDLTRREA